MMKSIVKGITTLGLFCVCILYGYSLNAQNLVSNGGLETWTVTDIPDDWDKYENVTEETIQVFEGTSSAKHSAGSGTKDMAQVISITGGEEYTISYRFFDNDDARTRIWSYWRTDGENISGVNEGLRPTIFSENSDQWQEVSLTLTAPAEANEFFFEVRVNNEVGGSGDGAVYHDDFSVTSTTFIHFTNLEEDEELPIGTHDFEFGLNNYELTSNGTPFPEIIRLYIDDVLTESVTTQVPMSVELTEPGAHTARVELINLVTSGETPILTSGNINFTVADGDLPPSLSVTGIVEDEVLATDEFSFGTTVGNFTVDNPSDGDGYIVYEIDAVSTDVFDADASTLVSGLSNGAHVLTVSLVDNAGAALDPAVTEVINFTVDVPVVIPPTLAITDISEGQTFDISDVSFGTTVGNFAVDNPSDGEGYITYSVDGADALDVFDADASTLLSGLSDGAHSLTVSLVDNSGELLDPSVSETVNFVVDTGSIFITFDSPMEGDEVNAGDIDFEFTVNNYTFGGPTPFPDVIELFIDGEPVGTINTGNTISANVTDLGPHTATLTLTNLVTGEFVPPVTTTINFTVVEDIVLDPTLTITSPLDGAEFTAGTIDIDYDIENYTLIGADVVSLYVNDELVISSSDVSQPLSFELTETGDYTAYVILEDEAGAFDPVIQSVVINITIVEEALPVISFVSPLNDAELDAGSIDFEYLLEEYVLAENDLVELYIDGDLAGSSAVSTTISADVTTGGAHTATFVLTNSVTGDFDPAVEATINFTVTVQLEDQSITLSNGWSIISMNVDPVDPNIATVMAPVVDDVFIVKDQIGNVYWPEFAVNSINDVDVLYGYQVKANLETTLEVTGVPVDPSTEIPLTEGWSIIGYLPTYDLDAAVAMESIAADITILKDESGEVYWPLFGINNIGNMTAGKGYQIKMFADNNLVYPAESSGRLASPIVKEELAHFGKASNTGRNMIIGIPTNAWSITPEYGDELAVLDAAGNITGSTVYTGQNTAITVWGDDDVTSIKDGLLDGEQLRLKYWNKADNKEWLMEVTWVEGDDYYMSEGINVAGTINLREASAEPISLLANTPNPFNETTNLRFYTESNEPIQVKVYNAIGALILEDVISIDAAGYNEYTINAKEMNSGTYFYHLSNSVFTTTGKMSLIK